MTEKDPMVKSGTSNTKSALTAEDPDFLLRISPEAEAFPGHRDGSVQRPPLPPDVVQEPG